MKIKANRPGIYLCLLVLGLALAVAGCAVTPAPPPAEDWKAGSAELGSIGVAVAQFEPEIVFAGYARGRLAGAGRGAGMGAAASTMAMLEAAMQSNDPYVLALWMVITPPVIVISTIGGSAGGAVVAEPKKVIEAGETEVRKTLASLGFQSALQERVVELAAGEAGRSLIPLVGQGPELADEVKIYTPYPGQEVDMVLELAVLKTGIMGKEGVNPPVSFFIYTQVRLWRVADGLLLFQRNYESTSQSRKFSQWCADEQEQLRRDYGRGIDELAARIVEDLFLLLPPANDSLGPVPIKAPGRFGTKKVDSRQPTLTWESFPSAEDQDWIAGRPLANVTYELKVIKTAAEIGIPEKVVELRGLTTTAHTLAEPLAANTNYQWRVRSRFELDGEVKLTPWSVPVDFKTPRRTYQPEPVNH